MNFSNACRLKKGLSLILIVLMVVGMFSGCKKNNSETEPNTTPSLNLNMSDTSAPTQETVPPTTTEPIVYNENMGTVTNQISVRVIPSKDANVTGKVLGHGKAAKILVYKYKSKKNYRRRAGHRQPFTKVEITIG